MTSKVYMTWELTTKQRCHEKTEKEKRGKEKKFSHKTAL